MPKTDKLKARSRQAAEAQKPKSPQENPKAEPAKLQIRKATTQRQPDETRTNRHQRRTKSARQQPISRFGVTV